MIASVAGTLQPSWVCQFTGLTTRQFHTLVRTLRTAGVDAARGRPWALSLEDRIVLIASYWRTDLTLRRLAPLFVVSKSTADRIVDHLGPHLELRERHQPRPLPARDAHPTLGSVVVTKAHTYVTAAGADLPAHAPDLPVRRGPGGPPAHLSTRHIRPERSPGPPGRIRTAGLTHG
ncbi:transposase family protein [Actinoplanes sp. N902-109]|uniref:helix-turn-helix domain-containing protein n=1 Tax=Actinoplanes sp. (strain N902-109) TaxID=649831 RepID=UPI00032967CA|nr:transposase for insertion sequence element [Actinoplanes sp. N902-109]